MSNNEQRLGPRTGPTVSAAAAENGGATASAAAVESGGQP